MVSGNRIITWRERTPPIGDLVAALEDRAQRLRVEFADSPRREDRRFDSVSIEQLDRAEFHGEWNYTISPDPHRPNRAFIS